MIKNCLILLSLIFLSYSCEQKKEQKSITAINKTELNKTDSLISHNKNKSSTVVKESGSITIPKSSIWTTDCKSDKFISIKIDINNIQFTIPGRFSMNTQLKKVGDNKYKFYFTDFPLIISLPDEMQNWDNLDHKKVVGYFEIIDDSKVNLTWFGFYNKKTKKSIQTKNPFNNVNNDPVSLIKCSE